MAVFRELKHGKYWASESYLCMLLTLLVLGGMQASLFLFLFSFLFCCYIEIFLFMLNNEK